MASRAGKFDEEAGFLPLAGDAGLASGAGTLARVSGALCTGTCRVPVTCTSSSLVPEPNPGEGVAGEDSSTGSTRFFGEATGVTCSTVSSLATGSSVCASIGEVSAVAGGGEAAGGDSGSSSIKALALEQDSVLVKQERDSKV